MPHATANGNMADGDDEGAINGILSDLGGGGNNFNGGDFGAGYVHVGEFDQTDKADDAQDYEDISDDDLPEEEEAMNPFTPEEDADDDAALQTIQNAFNPDPLAQSRLAPAANGYHSETHDDLAEQDVTEEHAGDLFGEGDDNFDLFGDRNSSPEQARAVPVSHAPAPQPHPSRPIGLALPSKSKSSLALPTLATNFAPPQYPPRRQSSDSLSVTSPIEEGPVSPASSYDTDVTDEDGMTEQELMQRKLFKQSRKRQAGEEVDDDLDGFDLDNFYSLFPRFETNQAPVFEDLFPARRVSFKPKPPLKAPRPVHATKIALELLPDQEKSFRAPSLANKGVEAPVPKDGLVYLNNGAHDQDMSDDDDDLALSVVDENERIGGVTMQDLAVICADWDIPSVSSNAGSPEPDAKLGTGDYDAEESARPRKKARMSILGENLSFTIPDPHLSFEDPERATAKIAKSVTLDLNDPHLLIDELSPETRRRTHHLNARRQRKADMAKEMAKRYNISNDKEYDKLKENHQHKVRATLGSMTVEHSLPAIKLQYPFYKVNLDSKQKRSFHRPHLDLRGTKMNFRFEPLVHIKRKHIRGREVKDLFAKSNDLYLGDSANVMMLEYSEEAPMMLSNFGMGNRLINYYRKNDVDDQSRPKRDIGETHVLLPQDKSPFANFGHVDKGEVVPTVQNGMFRAPVFTHKPKSTDFLVGVSSTWRGGSKFYLRNVDNLHAVGQQFPISEVPGQHSRKVTDAAKKRLRALSYRIYTKSHESAQPVKVLNNETIMPHLPGHDMPQTRSKMREFMKYERAPGKESGGVWVPQPGQVVPDKDTLRSWIRPEDVCLLDSMQVGVQHLGDLGIKDEKGGADDEKDIDESANIELQLAPWRTTKNFLNACQGKAMLALYGEGDPTGRGEGFSFVKTSMKGGFQALGQSADDKVQAKKRRDNGGHLYNVAAQQKLYDDSIRDIWNKQKESLGTDQEPSDLDMNDDADDAQGNDLYSAATPRSAFATPAPGPSYDDDSASQFSRGASVARNDQILYIIRKTKDKFGKPIESRVEVKNPRIASMYKKKHYEKQLNKLRFAQVPLPPYRDALTDLLPQHPRRRPHRRL